MATVVSRTFRSVPHRDAAGTWKAIVDLLTQDKNADAKAELDRVTGIAASVIADQYVTDAPIIVTSSAPRTRVYCLYDEAAIEGTEAREDSLGFDPLQGDWMVSLPCHQDDLDWVQAALKKQSAHVTARDMTLGLAVEASSLSQSAALELDVESFLKP